MPGDRADRHDLGEVVQLADREQLLRPAVAGSTRSILVTTAITVALSSAISPVMNRSPRPTGSSAGKHRPITSTSLQVSPDQVVKALAEQRAGPVQAGGVDQHELRIRRGAARPG